MLKLNILNIFFLSGGAHILLYHWFTVGCVWWCAWQSSIVAGRQNFDNNSNNNRNHDFNKLRSTKNHNFNSFHGFQRREPSLTTGVITNSS